MGGGGVRRAKEDIMSHLAPARESPAAAVGNVRQARVPTGDIDRISPTLQVSGRVKDGVAGGHGSLKKLGHWYREAPRTTKELVGQ